VEQKTNQKILFEIMLDASMTTDLQECFSLWLAFTPNYIAYVIKEQACADNECWAVHSSRDQVFLRRTKKRMMYELTLTKKEYEPTTLFLLLNKRRYELLRNYINTLI
jgi:hypothetical protein